ncbi:hypothetical protein [Streptomyces misionensis]|uniref:hypothetical protein n=1 Tax=Streptomyces misionensis TaxID=67331 RepID=UPI0033A2D970
MIVVNDTSHDKDDKPMKRGIECGVVSKRASEDEWVPSSACSACAHPAILSTANLAATCRRASALAVTPSGIRTIGTACDQYGKSGDRVGARLLRYPVKTDRH